MMALVAAHAIICVAVIARTGDDDAGGRRLVPLGSPRALALAPSAPTDALDAALYDDLHRWMACNGAQLPYGANATRLARIRYGKVLVRGVVAERPLVSDTPLVVLPARLLLSRESPAVGALAAPLERERMPAFVALVLVYLTEVERARREPLSVWAPLIRILERAAPDTPRTWSAARLARASPAMRALAALHARTVNATYAELQRRAPDALALAGKPSAAEFARAWDIAMARHFDCNEGHRAFSGGGAAHWLRTGRAMFVPLVELLNHGASKRPNTVRLVPARDAAPATHVGCLGAPAGERLELRLRRAYRPGEEVRITYSRHCAEEYALYYGFVPKGALPCWQRLALGGYWFRTMLRADGTTARLNLVGA